MGLRFKILAILLGTLTVLAVTSVSVLRVQANAQQQRQEHTDVTRDMRRLLNALNTPLIQLDSILRSWAHWTEFYKHARHPDPAFRKAELSAEALRLAQQPGRQGAAVGDATDSQTIGVGQTQAHGLVDSGQYVAIARLDEAAEDCRNMLLAISAGAAWIGQQGGDASRSQHLGRQPP